MSKREAYRRGPVLLRGSQIPRDTSDARLLASSDDAARLHEDPSRVLRIQSEFVEGFGALTGIGPAISVFGSARTPKDAAAYEQARAVGAGLANAG